MVGNLQIAGSFYHEIKLFFLSSTGLIVAHLSKVSFHELINNEYTYSTLLLEPNIMSCHLEPSTRHLLVSTRPSAQHTNVRHLVYEFMSNNNQAQVEHSLNVLQIFNGSNIQKLLARSKLFCQNSQLFGLAPCEATKSALIWDVASNELRTKLAIASDVIDVCSFSYRENNFVRDPKMDF